MRRVARALACCLVLAMVAGYAPRVAAESHPQARHKTGPISIRGIAVHVQRTGFTLQTNTRGSFTVVLKPQSQIDVKGHAGVGVIHEGDHVGVRGLLYGSELIALHVRIYPVKVKISAYDERGTVQSIGASQLVLLLADGTRLTVRLTASTQVQLGSSPGSLRAVRGGDHVLVRVEKTAGTPTAVRIHIYRVKVVPKHVTLHATVVAVSGSGLVAGVGNAHLQIRLNAQTVVRLGTDLTTVRSLKAGQSVTIHACCAGAPLTATSIHIRKMVARPVIETVKGQVAQVSSAHLRLSTGAGGVDITLTRDTVIDLGSTRLPPNGIHSGDDVSVRARKASGALIAERVHILAASRRPRSASGTVVAVSHTGLTIRTATGSQLTVNVGRGTVLTIGGHPGRLSALLPGERVKVHGTPAGTSSLSADRVQATPPKVKSRSIRGTIVSVSSSDLVVDSASGRFHVHLAPGVTIQLHGVAAPASAVFAGEKVHVKGHLQGQTLVATVVTITVTTRTVAGRITSVTASRLMLAVSSGRSVRVDVPSGLVVRDGTKSVSMSSLHAGAYARAQGYAEGTGAVRATRIDVTHPQLTLSAQVVTITGGISVQTSAGQRFRLRFGSSSIVSVSRVSVSIAPSDVPVGVHVRVVGTVGSDGAVLVSEMSVRLASTTVRGTIATVDAHQILLHAPSGTIQGRVTADTTVSQGTRALSPADLVAGDDVTLYGYKIASGMLVRKAAVHRPRATLTGTITALNQDGFTLTAPDGPHRVILETTTVATGAAPAVGLAVHVSGYKRGDGVILATRVRVGK